MSFTEVPDRISFPEKEEEILAWWEENGVFQESLKQSLGKPVWSFYDGPPFATGLPHYGHLLAGTIKDIVCRYAHQTGHYVERRFGWDCHGLPVEFEIDKMLGIKGKEDVLRMGIDKYNAECRAIVMRYSGEWQKTVKRLGRWIEFDTGYKTLDLSFMETVWWVFKQLQEKGLVYRGFKVMPYSCACNTPLSNFEVQQNYKDVNDPAVVCRFPLVDSPAESFLAWTTTPWTLPSNLALCVNPTMMYVKVKDVASGDVYILMEKRLCQLYPELSAEKDSKKYKEGLKKFEVLGEAFAGETLKGKQYTPPFSYFEAEQRPKGAYRVITGDFVTEDAGCGVVHCAPAFGEEDYKVCVAHGITKKGERLVCPIDDNGRFTEEVPDYKGLLVKDADKDIIAKLKSEGKMVRIGVINHAYPYCWRSDTPLIYRAIAGTFINVEAIKDRLIANNDKTYWVPDFVKEKRFKNWLENARDWSVSRNRFWGTPIPMWLSDDGEEMVVVGSIAELKELSGVTATDLHREHIDGITIPSKQGKGTLRRVDEVFDCWFESGSMPYAQQHYPFENKEKFEASFPADFIAEGIDQTRGWFYTLMVLSTALFDKPAFKNLICNGLVLAQDGQKMSKSKKNYPPPTDILDLYGADALRLYLINSPVVRADDLRFKKEGVLQVLKDIFNPWFHAYRLLVQCATAQQLKSGVPFRQDAARALASTNTMDRWILAAANGLLAFVRQEMEAYRLYTVVPRLVHMIEELTNWYVRMNKERFAGERGDDERADALSTLFEVLLMLCTMMSPLTPFFTELMYRNLRQVIVNAPASVHYLMMPEVNQGAIDAKIEYAIQKMQQVVENGRAIRDRKKLNMKIPLPEVLLVHRDDAALESVRSLEAYVQVELNVRSVRTLRISDAAGLVSLKCLPNHTKLAKGLGAAYKSLQKSIRELPHKELTGYMQSGSIVVDGHTLSGDDLLINLVFDGDKATYDAAECEGGLVVLCTRPNEAMLAEATTRALCAQVQKMRKDAGLQKQDTVEVCYAAPEGQEGISQLCALLGSSGEYVSGRIGRAMLPAARRPPGAVTLLEEEKEHKIMSLGPDGEVRHSTERLTLSLLRGCAFFHEDKLATQVPDAARRAAVQSYVHSKDLSALRKELTASGGALVVTFGDVRGEAREEVQLQLGEHFFLSSVEAAQAGAL